MREWRKPPGEICDGVLADVGAFLGDLPPHDDQTLMVVRLENVAHAGNGYHAAETYVPALEVRG